MSIKQIYNLNFDDISYLKKNKKILKTKNNSSAQTSFDFIFLEKEKYNELMKEITENNKNTSILENDVSKLKYENLKLQNALKTAQENLAINGKEDINKKIKSISELLSLQETSQEILNSKLRNIFQDYAFQIFQIDISQLNNLKNIFIEESKNVINFNYCYIFSNELAHNEPSSLHKPLFNFDSNFLEYLENLSENKEFDVLIENIYKLSIFMLLNDPLLTINLQNFQKRKFIYKKYIKNEFYCIDGFAKNNCLCLEILPPVNRKNYGFNGIKSAVLVLPEKFFENNLIIEIEKHIDSINTSSTTKNLNENKENLINSEKKIKIIANENNYLDNNLQNNESNNNLLEILEINEEKTINNFKKIESNNKLHENLEIIEEKIMDNTITNNNEKKNNYSKFELNLQKNKKKNKHNFEQNASTSFLNIIDSGFFTERKEKSSINNAPYTERIKNNINIEKEQILNNFQKYKKYQKLENKLYPKKIQNYSKNLKDFSKEQLNLKNTKCTFLNNSLVVKEKINYINQKDKNEIEKQLLKNDNPFNSNPLSIIDKIEYKIKNKNLFNNNENNKNSKTNSKLPKSNYFQKDNEINKNIDLSSTIVSLKKSIEVLKNAQFINDTFKIKMKNSYENFKEKCFQNNSIIKRNSLIENKHSNNFEPMVLKGVGKIRNQADKIKNINNTEETLNFSKFIRKTSKTFIGEEKPKHMKKATNSSYLINENLRSNSTGRSFLNDDSYKQKISSSKNHNHALFEDIYSKINNI